MSEFEIINAILDKIISWPVAIVFIAFLLRKTLSKITGKIKSVKYGDLEISLSNDVNKVYEMSAHAVSMAITTNPNVEFKDIPEIFRSRYIEIAETSPFAVIIFAYSQIENAIVKPIEQPESMLERERINREVNNLFHLKEKGISSDEYNLFYKLQEIHDTVLEHNITNIKAKDSLKYGKAAGYLIALINSYWEP